MTGLVSAGSANSRRSAWQPRSGCWSPPPYPNREFCAARRGGCAWAAATDAEAIPDQQAHTFEHELLAAERHAALREALAQLAPRDRQLLAVLTADPPVPYAEISVRLGIPVDSIGPTRGRCLDKLRRHPAIAC